MEVESKHLRIGVNIRGLLTGKISGIEQYALQTLRHLLEIDQQNTYVLYYVSYKNYDQRVAELLRDHAFLSAPNVEIRSRKWINGPLFLHAAFKFFNFPKADLAAGGLDVMWLPSPELLPLSNRCPRVVTFHDVIFFVAPQTYTLKSRLWQWQMDYPRQARIADHIIVPSKSTQEDIMRILRAPAEKISLIPEGVGEEYFEPVDPEIIKKLRSKFGIPEQYLYYVGSLEPRKNLVTAARALKDLPDTIKLVLSGSKSWLAEDFYKLITEAGLEGRVIFTGRVSEEEKIALMRGSLAFVFPSIYEGFGLMILEAFAAGTPVITSNVSSMPEVAGDAGILIDPHDSLALAAAVKKIIAEPDYRDELIRQGKAIAREYSWQKSARATLDVIIQTANGK